MRRRRCDPRLGREVRGFPPRVSSDPVRCRVLPRPPWRGPAILASGVLRRPGAAYHRPQHFSPPNLHILDAAAALRTLRRCRRAAAGRPVVPRLLAVAGLSGLIMAKGFSTVPADRGRERPNAVATLVRYFSARDTDTGRVLVPIAYLPALHYYYPTLRAAPYSEGSDGLAHTARQALDNGYPGLLYASHAREGFGNLLPPERIERIDTIAVAPTIPFYAFYYHLGR